MRATVAILAALVLSACAAPVKLATPSGRPEVQIPGASKRAVFDTIASDLLARGMQLRRQTDYSLTFGKKVESFAAAVLYGSRYDATPEARITFNVVDATGGVKVFATAEMVTNPGSAYERTSDATESNAAELQGMLQRLRARF